MNGMRWFKKEADGITAANDPTKTLAFSICLTARNVVLYVHSYSPEEQQFFMSCIASFLPTKATDIQECRNHIKNIIEYALNVRYKDISDSLDNLIPIPTTWPNKKSRQRGRSSTVCSTPATSFTDQSTRKS